jgi:hypothetical protein
VHPYHEEIIKNTKLMHLIKCFVADAVTALHVTGVSEATDFRLAAFGVLQYKEMRYREAFT